MTAYGGQKCVTVRPGRYVHHGVQRYDLKMIMMGGVANRRPWTGQLHLPRPRAAPPTDAGRRRPAPARPDPINEGQRLNLRPRGPC